MPNSIFAGVDELNDAYRRVGLVLSNCSLLEEAISYLEWQLIAFSWNSANPSATQADRQTALRAERQSRDKYADLEKRLTAVTKAFEAEPVANRIKRSEELRHLRRDWETLRERARALAKRRNEIGHTYLSYSPNGHVLRQTGRPWKGQAIVTKADDEALITELWELTHELGAVATRLGRLLPFADDDQIIVD